MQVDQKTVVTIHYTIQDASSGEELETTKGEDALPFLFGVGALPEKVEEALKGKQAGDKLTLDLACDDAFGPKSENSVQRYPKKYFKKLGKLVKGDVIPLKTEEGVQVVSIVKVGHSVVDVDMNHPFAGRDVKYDIEVTDVREATAEEVDHGHAHGPGGHQH